MNLLHSTRYSKESGGRRMGNGDHYGQSLTFRFPWIFGHCNNHISWASNRHLTLQRNTYYFSLSPVCPQKFARHCIPFTSVSLENHSPLKNLHINESPIWAKVKDVYKRSSPNWRCKLWYKYWTTIISSAGKKRGVPSSGSCNKRLETMASSRLSHFLLP